MSVENTPTQGTGEVSSIPEDYAAYQQFRTTGELPKADEQKEQSEVAEESAAGSESVSETDEVQEQGEEQDEQERDEKGRFSKRGLNKRFHELTSEIRDLKRQLSDKGTASVASSEVRTEQKADGEPQAKDYDDYNVYLRDLAKFTVKSERENEQRAEATRRQQEQERVAFESWQTRENALRDKHSDYDDSISKLQIPDTPAVAELRGFLAESELGPELLYHLAKNPAEADRIVKLSPRRAVAEIGKLEEKLTPAPKPKPKTVTSAPPPPQPVGGKSTATVKPLNQVDDYAEYQARRRKGEKF